MVGPNEPPYFVADIGANHDGSLERAFMLIELAKASGADAAKFQNFQASKIVSNYGFSNLGMKLSHQAGWKKSVYEIYEDASVSMDWTARLKAKCMEVGIEYFTSPYDFESIDHVDPYVNVYKIGSGDITWTDIVEYIAGKKKPILLATGASDISDVTRAMKVIELTGATDVCLMQCNTNYTVDPSKYRYVNLNVLKTYQTLFPNVLLGLSDHTLGFATVAGAIPLGARVFEKHFTDNNNNEGPDHKFAMNPTSWRQMVDVALEVFYALGDGIKRVEDNEIDSKIVQQRCLRATADLDVGTDISSVHLESLRPFPKDGIRPFELKEIVGRKLVKKMIKGEHITFNHLSES